MHLIAQGNIAPWVSNFQIPNDKSVEIFFRQWLKTVHGLRKSVLEGSRSQHYYIYWWISFLSKTSTLSPLTQTAECETTKSSKTPIATFILNITIFSPPPSCLEDTPRVYYYNLVSFLQITRTKIIFINTTSGMIGNILPLYLLLPGSRIFSPDPLLRTNLQRFFPRALRLRVTCGHLSYSRVGFLTLRPWLFVHYIPPQAFSSLPLAFGYHAQENNCRPSSIVWKQLHFYSQDVLIRFVHFDQPFIW